MASLNSEARSENMRKIRSQNARPEIIVPSRVHRPGLTFSSALQILARQTGSGAATLTEDNLRSWVFLASALTLDGGLLNTRLSDWRPKLQRNVERDSQNCLELRSIGWQSMTIWSERQGTNGNCNKDW